MGHITPSLTKLMIIISCSNLSFAHKKCGILYSLQRRSLYCIKRRSVHVLYWSRTTCGRPLYGLNPTADKLCPIYIHRGSLGGSDICIYIYIYINNSIAIIIMIFRLEKNHVITTVPKSYQEIAGTEAKSIRLYVKHIYKCT